MLIYFKKERNTTQKLKKMFLVYSSGSVNDET